MFCGNPIDARLPGRLEIEIASPPQGDKSQRDKHPRETATQRHARNPELGERPDAESEDIGEADIEQGTEEQEPQGGYDVARGAQAGGENEVGCGSEVEHAQPENKAGSGQGGFPIQPEQPGNGLGRKYYWEAQQGGDPQGQQHGSPVDQLGLPHLTRAPAACYQRGGGHRYPHQDGLDQEKYPVAGRHSGHGAGA